MWIPWRLDEGPEFLHSREAIASDLRRFEENFAAVRYALKRDPAGWSVGLLEERDDLRVIRTQDFREGYEVVVFFRMDVPAHACRLMWVEVRALGPEEETDPGPQGLT